MKLNLPVTDRECKFDDDTVIISTTDLKGIITSVNDDFCRISGFNRQELIGKSHNIVRHPDMPAAGFADLWATLKRGESWMGIVKNRAKNGDYYWVDAYVAPVEEHGRVIGYQSVRRRPDPERVARAERLYKSLNAGKVPALLRYNASYTLQLFIVIAAVALATTFIAWAFGAPLTVLAAQAMGGTCVAGAAAWFLGIPLRRESVHARELNNNPLIQAVYSGRRDEVGQLFAAMSLLKSRLATVVGRIDEHAALLSDAATAATQNADSTRAGMDRQHREIESLAGAVNQMAASVRSVAQHAADTASAARHADAQVKGGAESALAVSEGIRGLMDEVERTAQAIASLEQESANIGLVLDVIKGVAEQTNLLALNAAIEAARAGEQGRGFAVVADEVRSLATRVHDSAEQIKNMIHKLQTGSRQAVTAMSAATAQAQQRASQVEEVSVSLRAIASEVTSITGMSGEVATAAGQQSLVAEEINRNIHQIRTETERAASGAHQTAEASESLVKTARELEVLVKQCR